jgi:hypothetical protein
MLYVSEKANKCCDVAQFSVESLLVKLMWLRGQTRLRTGSTCGCVELTSDKM